MGSSRIRDGTVTVPNYDALIRGIRGVSKDEHHRSSRLRNANGHKGAAKPFSVRNSSMAIGLPSKMCILRTQNYRDELAQILGDSDPPYYRLFGDDEVAADTSHTRPTAEDRALAKHVAKLDPRPGSGNDNGADGTKMTIHFGEEWSIDAWYKSAYPAEYTRRDYMTVCCYCLGYTLSDLTASRHSLKCCRRFPPGREIYRNGKLSMWELDGSHASLYCQNLCLLAKAFLSSKNLYKDVQPFFFYVLTELTDDGAKFLGYFSKQKLYSVFRPSAPIQSVSCIMTLPFAQQQGIGQFLIDFSYLLTRIQDTTGQPETPLSALGEASFRRYWKRTLCYVINDHLKNNKPFTLRSLAKESGINLNHVVVALEDLGWLVVTKYDHSKKHIGSTPKLVVNKAQMEEIIDSWEKRNPIKVDPSKLMWTPLNE